MEGVKLTSFLMTHSWPARSGALKLMSSTTRSIICKQKEKVSEGVQRCPKVSNLLPSRKARLNLPALQDADSMFLHVQGPISNAQY